MNLRIAIIIFFLIPLIPMPKTFSLAGVIEDAPRAKFSWHGLATGKYQEQFEKYFSRHFGFYSALVRLDNTLNFALQETNFNSSRCVVIANSDVYFAPDELQMRERRSFDWPKIEEKIRVLALGTKKLKSMGIDVVVLYVPAKINYYEEAIPDRWKIHREGPLPYKEVTSKALALMKSLGVPVLNAEELIAEIGKATGRTPYPRRGRHWTQLVSCEVLGKISRPGFTCLPAVEAEGSKAERDQYECINAFLDFKAPERVFRPAPTVDKVSDGRKALFVGSSFTRELETEARRLDLFADLHDFYYNKTDFVGEKGEAIKVGEAWKDFVRTRNLIVVDFFEPQVDEIGHGFMDQVLREF